MKIVVFGASGGVGKHLVEQALHDGNTVRAVYRAGSDSIARAQSNLEVTYLEDFFDSHAIAEVVSSTDAVICCLGPRRENPKNPWSNVTSPLNLMECFSKALIEAMAQPDMPRRVVVVSAAGVGLSAPRMHPVLRFVFDHSNVGLGYQDLARMEEQIQRSNLDWTIVRPVTLTTGQLTGKIKLCNRYGLTNSISRADVAAYLLQRLQSSSIHDPRTPMICSK